MTTYKALAIATSYWKPSDNFQTKIVEALAGKIQNGDFVVVSEKALSTALGKIIDETNIKPGSAAKFLAGFWMQKVWGYPLGILCGFGQRLLKRLRQYPAKAGSRHKQVALQYAGILQALMFGSEGGIDGSNLAYSFVSLPLSNPEELAKQIQAQISQELGKRICIIIADTDKTYKLRNFYFTPRPNPLLGIKTFGGFAAYAAGRLLKLKKSSTPLAVSGSSLAASQALSITNIADRARGAGSGATVWDMAARFHVPLEKVTWDMLEEINHKPIVIVRKTN
jgi:F420-0:gamma-glutamyl ligase-like protein